MQYLNKRYKNFFSIIFSRLFVSLIVLTGILSVMPIISLKLNHTYVSLFTISFIILFILLFMRFIIFDCRIELKFITKLYLIWLLLSILSSFLGLFYFWGQGPWIKTILLYIPKLLIFSFFLIILSSYSNKKDFIHFFLLGFLTGIILNAIWSCIDGFIFYQLKFSINNVIFRDYFKTMLPANRQFISIVRNETIRTTGFNYDPAHLGALLPILIGFSIINSNLILLLISILAIVFSQSTTGLVVSIVIIIFLIWKRVFFINFKIIHLLLMLILLLFGIFYFNKEFIYFISNFNNFFERIQSVYLQGTFSTNNRVIYHKFFPSVVNNNFMIFTGSGFGTASYSYLSNDLIRSLLGYENIKPFDPESVYISYFFNVGILGVILYIFVVFYNLRKLLNQDISNKNYLIMISLISIFVSGFFYHYILTSYQVLIIIMASIINDNEIGFSEKLKIKDINNKNN